MFAVTRLRAPADDVPDLLAAAADLLAALRARPGFRDGAVGRAADDDSLCALWTAWDGVGAYRRALSAPEVKIAGAPVWVHALDEPGAYLTGEALTDQAVTDQALTDQALTDQALTGEAPTGEAWT